MKVIMFFLSLVILAGMAAILGNAIVKDSPIYVVGVILASMMFALSIMLTVITYMELRDKY